MKAAIICPECIERNQHVPEENRCKPQVLAKYEDVVGRGDLYVWCKKCRKEIHIRIDKLSLNE